MSGEQTAACANEDQQRKHNCVQLHPPRVLEHRAQKIDHCHALCGMHSLN
jgi:hypothetical protein